jgi:hypothetical protein
VRVTALILGALLLGCGRLGFDPVGGGAPGDGSGDGSGDAVANMPQPRCTTTYQNAVLCDDFETNLDKWFIDVAGTNQIVQDTTFARSGSASAHVIATGTANARLIATPLPSAMSGTYYFRFYAYFPSSTVLDAITVMHVVSDVTPYPGLLVELLTNDMFTVHNTIDGSSGNAATTTLKRDAWVCYQASLVIASSGSFSTTVDGVPSADYAGNTVAPNGYVDFHIGAFVEQTQGMEMWLDDAVVDTSPVPCD